MEEFKDFEKYVKGVDPYGMQSGIVLIDPPEEWYVCSISTTSLLRQVLATSAGLMTMQEASAKSPR